MKRVVSSEEVPHLWYQQTQSEARNGRGTLYFRDSTIYSYGGHFPIAQHVRNDAGERAVLFTTREYSPTTGEHKHAVRWAIPDDALIFNVYDMGTDHDRNVNAYITDINSSILKCSRARSSWNKQYSHARAVSLLDELQRYVAFYGLELPTVPVIPALDSAELDAIRKKEASAQAAKRAKEKVEEAERVKKYAARAEDWRNGSRPQFSLYDLPVMLRIVADTLLPTVETSHGATVPVSHAKRALALVRQVVARKVEYVPNGKTFHIGHYAINRIETDGTLHAGCHVIKLAEIERIAPELEALSVPAAE